MLRKPGFSFVIRARNEAEVLFDNFVSLHKVKVPHEIILVLHRCNDESKQVAEAWQKQGLPIRVFEDQTLVSRAGYETLVTPAKHPNSFPEFCNRCFAPAQYNWLIRWDADFSATDVLLDLLHNQINPAETAPTSYQLTCRLGSDVICREEYMFNTYHGFSKYYFWEQCVQTEPRESIVINDACIQSIPPTVVKPYWQAPPWFLTPNTYDKTLADKYAKVVSIVGPEPTGFARSNNPEFMDHWRKLMAAMPEFEAAGIYPTE